VDRCALFVDAGYVLADGAMAVHGTRRRESVSWDYAGLVQFLGGMAKEQSGLPLLRCYWYEATVEGRRSTEHDTLADLPGVKLRLAKMRPGHREGVEGEIHRDITTLARNKAVTDAVVLSAEEDLAQVVADVQDLGMRVTLLHIAVDGNGTVPRALRQECDDIVEVSSAHLRPYVELISGAEPPGPDERDGASIAAFHLPVNGRGQAGDTAPRSPAPQEAENNNGRQALPSRYAPPAAGYQQPAARRPHLADQAAAAAVTADAAESEPTGAREAAVPPGSPARPDLSPVQPDVPAEQDQAAAPYELPATATTEYLGVPPDLAVVRPEQAQVQPPYQADYPAPPDLPARQDVYGTPVAVPALPDEQPVAVPAPLPARGRATADLSGYNPGAMRDQPSRDAMVREPLPGEAGEGEGRQPVPAAQVAPASAQVRRLPTRGNGQPPQPAQPGQPAQPAAVPHLLSAPTAAPAAPPTAAQPLPPQPLPMPPGTGQPGAGQPVVAQPGVAQPGQPTSAPFGIPQPEAGQPGGLQAGSGQSVAPVMPMHEGAGYTATRNGSYGGPPPVVPAGPGAPGTQGAPAFTASAGAGAGGPGNVAPAAASRLTPAGGLTAADGPSVAGGPGSPAGPSGLATPAGAQQAGLGTQGGHPGSGFGVPNLPAPAGGQGPAVNGTGQPTAYAPQGAGGPGSPAGPGGFGAPGGGPVGPLGQSGPAYSGAPAGGSLADAVQSAHREGQEFGESIARDAPALWLEAVLARKPRMPSDLEARLLQGSALPIDYLLHDEVRHALRRGFWDALERARR
jgi:NYN domain